MGLRADQPGILTTVAYNERNVKLEELAGVDSQRTLTLRHDESFEAQTKATLRKNRKAKKYFETSGPSP